MPRKTDLGAIGGYLEVLGPLWRGIGSVCGRPARNREIDVSPRRLDEFLDGRPSAEGEAPQRRGADPRRRNLRLDRGIGGFLLCLKSSVPNVGINSPVCCDETTVEE